MKLRTRLALAFFLMSVLPLAAVTLYSYISSEQAFRRLAQTESETLATEMSRRMQSVTLDLEQRVNGLWFSPAERAAMEQWREARNQSEVQQTVVAALGSTAGLLDRIEIIPTPGAPPTPAAPPEPPASGRTPDRRPPPPPPPGDPARRHIVVDLSATDAGGQAGAAAALGADELRRLRTRLDEQWQQRAKTLEEQAKRVQASARAAEAAAGVSGGGRPSSSSRRPQDVGFTVRRDGVVVGTVNARLNLGRTLRTVMAMTRRDQGEIPFAIDADRTVHAPGASDRATLAALGLPDREGDTPETISGPDGDWVLVTQRTPSGMVFGIARPIGRALHDLRRAAAQNLALGLSVVALAFIGIVPLSRRMTRNLSFLTEGVHRIAQGDLSARVPVRSRDEFGELGEAVNQMAQDLEAHQRLLVQQERLKRELELCRQIQTDMLPHERLRHALTEVKGVSIPAREVGGDFFNYFALSDGDVALLVGDVAGKGVGAALLMANIQATLRARLPLDRDLTHLVAAVDREIEETMPRGVYLTLFIGIYSPSGKVLRYVNAGHPPQFLLRGDGRLERLSSTGLPVGLFAGHGYEERSLTLASGDVLFFYTDGIIEVENEAGEMFGTERLESLLTPGRPEDVDGLLAEVERQVHAFRGRAEQFDDATMMVLRLGSAAPGDATGLTAGAAEPPVVDPSDQDL